MSEQKYILEIYPIMNIHDFNPREQDENSCTIAYFSRDYLLGDKRVADSVEDYILKNCDEVNDAYYEEGMDCYDVDDVEANEFIREKFEELYYHRPVYAYIHGGVTISVGSFSCPWDSGQSGFIYMSKKAVEDIFKYYGSPDSKFKTPEDVFNHISQGEVEEFDKYLTGQVYRYVLRDEDGEVVDSCSGFLGDDVRENGILGDCVDPDEVSEIHYMEQQNVTVWEAGQTETLAA